MFLINPKYNQSTQRRERLETFLESIPIAFASCQLQYVMDQQICDIELIVLISQGIIPRSSAA